MDIIKEIYNQVSARLKSQVPEIRFIDFDNGQLETDEIPTSFPCALIDITDIDYRDAGEDDEDDDDFAVCQVTVKMAFETLDRTNSLMVSSNALTHSAVLTKSMQAIKGFKFTNTDKFVRRKLTRLPYAGVKAYLMVFNVSIFGDC